MIPCKRKRKTCEKRTDMDLYTKIERTGLIPVIKISKTEYALPLAKALRDGGLNAAEITFRTDCAAEAISLIRAAYPDMLIGAGTVLTPEQADKASDVGADFIVSPGLNPTVVQHCLDKNIPIIPGCATPSDLETALSFGLTHVKFFPAEAAGGLPMIKAMSAPYGNIRFMPTGGINEKNLLSYLSFGKIFACGGSFMVPDKLMEAGDFAEITALTRKAVSLMLGFSLEHIGINAANQPEAERAANLLDALFGLDRRELPVSYFSGPFEVMKSVGRGQHGHIAVACHDIDRAMFHLESRGFAFDKASIQQNEKGQTTFVYLADEILGFAIHLIRK